MNNNIEERLGKIRKDILEIRDLRKGVENDRNYIDTRIRQIQEQAREVKERRDEIIMLNFLENVIAEIMALVKNYFDKTNVLIKKAIELLKSRLNEWEIELLD